MSTMPPVAQNTQTTESTDPAVDSWRGVKLGVWLLLLCVGWAFILWQNKFRITPSVAIACLGYLAVVATIVNLWRTGVAVAERENPATGAWDRPIGPLTELEKEKRTLLKAIKEAEFDFAMGKLSSSDSEALIQMYRTRAIEVIKELDQQSAGRALSPREQIQGEVKARLALARRAGQDKKSAAHEQHSNIVEDSDSAKAAAETETAAGEPQ